MKRKSLIAVLAVGILALVSKGEEPKGKEKPKQPKTAVMRALLKTVEKAVTGNDEEMKQIEQKFPQLRELYRMELYYMNKVCQPTKKQIRKILADGEKELRAVGKKYASMMGNQQRGMIFQQGGALVARGRGFDPRKRITDALAKSVSAHLSEEQAARYQKELGERTAARKRASRLSLIAAMDKVLLLTQEQREQLDDILEENWNDSWSTQSYVYSGQYFPQMPDHRILPVLTEAQKRIWSGVQKVSFGFNAGIVFQGIDVGVWISVDLEESPPGEREATEGEKGQEGAEKKR